jgi:Asp/Glu/hydantoin racemase
MNERARIALIHALEESVVPARAAFADLWPDAHIFDLLETSLATDLADRGRVDEAMIARFQTLADYAWRSAEGVGGKTRAILFTCSAFGPAIDAVKTRLPIPVLRPNEAAFETALDRGSQLGLVVTFGPSRAALEAELHAMAAMRRQSVTVETILAEGALAALKRGDAATHDRLAAEAGARLKSADAIILGQFSLARARNAVAAASGRPVVTTPHAAVDKLRHAVASSRPRQKGSFK